jgi:hypothetical protein
MRWPKGHGVKVEILTFSNTVLKAGWGRSAINLVVDSPRFRQILAGSEEPLWQTGTTGGFPKMIL